jgi:acetoin utilization protein AcuB
MPIDYEAYIKEKMQKKLITIGPDASFYEARAIIRDRGIRHLPVVDKENRLLGLITDRDIRKATPSDATTLSIHEIHYLMGKLKVSGFMTPKEKLITITGGTMIERAVELMHDHKIGCLPVVEGGKLIGIITGTDVLELFVDLFGIKRVGTRLTVALEDQPGQLHDILEVIKNLNVNIITVATPTFKVEGRRIVTIRVEAEDCEGIVKELEEAGHEILSVDKHKGGASHGS